MYRATDQTYLVPMPPSLKPQPPVKTSLTLRSQSLLDTSVFVSVLPVRRCSAGTRVIDNAALLRINLVDSDRGSGGFATRVATRTPITFGGLL